MRSAAFALAFVPALACAQLALHNGDRVVFYGDSITDQRLYSFDTEAFIRTRLPRLNVSFVHSGWGGDRVSGGGGGDIEARLTRDVLAYKPTMVTIMLGMNDGNYSPFNQKTYDTFTRGYEHIVDRLRREDQGVRFTLIQPSPYDDATRAPSFEGGYNSVLLKFSDFIKDFGTRAGCIVSDFNTPVVEMLKAANAKDPALAPRIILDRVHPGDAGHLIMAEALLKSWNVPGVVSAVEFADGKLTHVENAKVSDISTQGGLSWTEQEGALPFPLNLRDPSVRLVTESSDFVQALDQETVKVAGLTGRYNLTIDGKKVGTYSADELSTGVNLANLDTPMHSQAQEVVTLTRIRSDVHNQRWRSIQMYWVLGIDSQSERLKQEALDAMDKCDNELDRVDRRAAQPKPHKFALIPAP